jgi:hypothetical protein
MPRPCFSPAPDTGGRSSAWRRLVRHRFFLAAASHPPRGGSAPAAPARTACHQHDGTRPLFDQRQQCTPIPPTLTAIDHILEARGDTAHSDGDCLSCGLDGTARLMVAAAIDRPAHHLDGHGGPLDALVPNLSSIAAGGAVCRARDCHVQSSCHT